MQALSSRAGPGALLALAHALRAAALHVAAVAHRLDAWLAVRAKRADDRETLAQMSDYELNDIGLAPGFRSDVASGAWRRDLPH